MNNKFTKIIFILIILLCLSKNSLATTDLTTKSYEEVKAEKKIYLLGQFEPANRKDFILIPNKYLVGGGNMYLQKEAYDAFLKMRTAALKDKITLSIASATRNFYYQKLLWEKKWDGITLAESKKFKVSVPDELIIFRKILEYSAAPGTSRHHWGTDIDINSAKPAYFNTKMGQNVYTWLVKNAGTYGFCQPYNLKDEKRLRGYNEERWHWSYLPTAKELTKDYANLIKEEDLVGFKGDAYVKNLNLLNNYVLSINPKCL